MSKIDKTDIKIKNYKVQTIKELEIILTTVAKGMRNMMSRSKTTKAALAKKIGRDVEWVEKVLDGFNDEISIKDIKTMATALGYVADIDVNMQTDTPGVKCEITNDGFVTLGLEEMLEPPDEED